MIRRSLLSLGLLRRIGRNLFAITTLFLIGIWAISIFLSVGFTHVKGRWAVGLGYGMVAFETWNDVPITAIDHGFSAWPLRFRHMFRTKGAQYILGLRGPTIIGPSPTRDFLRWEIEVPLWSAVLPCALIHYAVSLVRRRNGSHTLVAQYCVCGYSLRGNMSGCCPECGVAIPEKVKERLRQCRSAAAERGNEAAAGRVADNTTSRINQS